MLRIAFFTIIILSFLAGGAQHEDKYVPETDPAVLDKLEQWQGLKFGLLMHWGPYSQWGIVESWSICAEDEGWCRRKGEDYTAYKKEYENLKTTFNPVQFEPQNWARAAKGAGMRYVIFTTKHHDGFCMFDTRLTDYKITDEGCPFHVNDQANVTREIFDAFRDEGMWVGPYFSKPDWHSEYYWWPNFATPDRHANYPIKAYPERWESFIDFTHGQIMELMSDYGPVDILWLDGGWVRPRTDEEILKIVTSPNYKFTNVQSQDIRMDELVDKAREKQPGLIVVDRAVPGINQNYLTPENRVPEKALPYPWESCIIAGGGWSWAFNPTFMSDREGIHLLVDIVAKGGNLLLNIAPSPEGVWHPEAYRLLKGYEDWMAVNSEAIYETRAIDPYKEGKVCLTQKSDGTTYAIYLAGPSEEAPPEKIWMSTVRPDAGTSVYLLGYNEQLSWKEVGEGFYAEIPESFRKNPPCRHAWTLKIENIEITDR